MPLPEPDDLNPLTDVLYLETGKIKKITPKHPETKPKELLMVTAAALHLLGETLYGKERKHKLKQQPAWAECLIGEISNELNISPDTLLAILNGFFNKDYAVQFLNTDGFRSWGVKEGLDQLHPFLERGIEEIKAYYESKPAAEPLPGEDQPRRSFGNG